MRGSTPSPGVDFAVFGGHTSCVSVQGRDGTRLIFDAGTGLRVLGDQLLANEETDFHLFLTHLHWDHIIGLPFFKPLYRPSSHLRVHPLSTPEQDRFRSEPVIISAPHHPVGLDQLPSRWEAVDSGGDFQLGCLRVQRIPLAHPGGAVGFRVDEEGGGSFLYLTDNELEPGWEDTDFGRGLIERSKGADLMLHDAQYTPADMPLKRGWGHSEVQEVLKLGRRAEVSTLVPFHHDPERTDAQLHQLETEGQTWARDIDDGLTVRFAREGAVYEV